MEHAKTWVEQKISEAAITRFFIVSIFLIVIGRLLLAEPGRQASIAGCQFENPTVAATSRKRPIADGHAL
jgi:hypothetical protein